MAEVNVPVYDFRHGVLTPKLKDRPNLDLYKSGVLLGHNWHTQFHGPTNFRPGFMYNRPTRRNNKAWLITFAFDDNEAYCLEFTEGYMRIHSNTGTITESQKVITGVTQASPGVVTITGHGYDTGDEVYIDGVGGMTDLNGRFFLITRIDANTFSLQDQDGNDFDTTSFDVYTGGGTSAKIYEIASPYKEDSMHLIKYAQKADIMYIDHPLHLPRKLMRSGITDWEFKAYTRTNDPFDQKTITGITQANPGVVTTGASHNLDTGDTVIMEEVGGMTEVNAVEYHVTKLSDTTFSIQDLDGNDIDTSGFGAYTSGGYGMKGGDAPATCGFYGGRLFHGGSDNDPDILNGSRSSDTSTGQSRYDDFTLGSDADHAVIHGLTSATETSIARIRFFIGTRQFLGVGTYSGMLKVNGGSDTTPISGTDIASFPVDYHGVANMMPVAFGNDILYVQRGRRVVSAFKYTIMSDGFESTDETIQSDEITRPGIVQMAFVRGTPDRIWACMEDGTLCSLVYNRSEEISAWNSHSVGGDGKVISLASEPQDDREFRLWICVERVVNGVTRRYIEYSVKNPHIPERDEYYSGDEELDKQRFYNLLFEAQKRQVFLDSALVLDTTQNTSLILSAKEGEGIDVTVGDNLFTEDDVGKNIQVKHIEGTEEGVAIIVEYTSATEVKCNVLKPFSELTYATGEWYLTQQTVSGLDHLEGEAVVALIDGGLESDDLTYKTVENGSIELDDKVTYAIIGLPYVGRLKSMPLELLLNTGITPGKVKTISQVNLMFRNSLGVSYGYDPYNLQRIGFRVGGQFTDRPTRLYSGVKNLPGFDIWGEQRHLWLIQNRPYPCTLNAMVVDTELDLTEDGG